MEEIVKKKEKGFTGIDALIILMMAVSAVIGIMMDELEMKIITGILFVLGGLIFFTARSSRKKKIDQISVPDNNSIDDSYSTVNDKNGINPAYSDGDGNEETAHHEDFVIIKSIPNNKKNKHSALLTNRDTDAKTELKGKIKAEDCSSNNGDQLEMSVSNNYKSSSPVFNDEDYSISGKDPKSEFGVFLKNVMDIIKEITFAHSVLFYWVDTERKLIVFDSAVTSSENLSLMKKDSFEFGSNLVSRIAVNAKSEIVTDINPDSISDLLGYYNCSENVKSVIGIPIFFEENLIGILIADSLEEDAYGPETVSQLNYFVSLLSNLIKSSTEKFEYFTDSKILSKIDEVHELARSDSDLNLFIKEVSKSVNDLLDWDFSALVLHENGEWIIKEVTKKDPLKSYVSTRQKVDFDNSLVGNVLQENKFTIVEDVTRLAIPRFSGSEKIISAGSLLIMPVYSFSQTYGALVFESTRSNYYTSEDANLLNKICKSVASLIEIVALKNYIDENVPIDTNTAILKNSVMMRRLSSELDRQKDFGSSNIFLLLSIDKHDELIYKYGVSGFNTVLLSTIEILNSAIPSYDFIGRMDENVIGVFRAGLNLDDGKVFAEKIRKLTAGNIISVDAKSFSVTLSVGFVETKKYSNSAEIIENCMKVLKIAFEEGGNRVKIN